MVIHPQSIVHSLVEYVDGSMIAQLANPDMRMPIAHALAYPERIDSGAQPLDLSMVKNLSFEKPDAARFPCLQLAYAALRAGGTAPAVLNAANEVAVAAFLDRRLAFTGIRRVIQKTLERVAGARRGRPRRHPRRRRRGAPRGRGADRAHGGREEQPQNGVDRTHSLK